MSFFEGAKIIRGLALRVWPCTFIKPSFFMRIPALATVLLTLISMVAAAQADLFGAEKVLKRHGLVLGFNGDLDLPGADMAKRFGASYRIGPSVLYKTDAGFLFGVKADFIFGNQIREDSLLSGVRDTSGFFINENGQRVGIGIFERGYAIGVECGKIFPLSKLNPNTGLLVMTGFGFIQHKITLTDKDKTIWQISGDYAKGYDRLTNGLYVEQFVGYNRFDKKGAVNFHIGLDVLAGFTRGRRDYLYDVRRPDNAARADLLFGIRGGWYIPIFKKKSEELYFE